MREIQNRVIELPESLRNKIAAGEVIEGPFSCVKELIENSIDAESSQITIDIEEGGKRLISVSDNGTGIHPEDLQKVVRRYSTSKISEPEDLDSIESLGFRGEALASIASVSQLEILTKNADSEIGRYIKVENGEIVDEKMKPRQRGTSVFVKYLFNNLPGRRKFLHSSSAEFRKIMNEVIPKCIAFPEISFVLTHNGRDVINIRSGTREDRLLSIMDESFFNSLIPVKYENDEGVRIEGWIQKPNMPSQKKYYLFVNRRNIWDGKIFRIIRDYYNPFSNENPSYILFIDYPSNLLDVNVHPAKKEVRFRMEKKLYNSLYKMLDKSLGEESDYRSELLSIETDYLFESDETSKFWQLHNSYILAQTRNGFVIIDQHAAHERIIFDNLKKNTQFPSQSLLFPMQIKHTPLEVSKLEEIRDKMNKLGFRFHILSGNTISWEGIPAIVEDATAEGITGILEDLSEERENSLDRILKAIACHMSVKAGQSLSEQEMEHLVNLLFQTDKPFRCPHGRPVIWEISLEELERKFLR